MRSPRVCQSPSQHPKARPKMTCVKPSFNLAKQVFGSAATVPQHPFSLRRKTTQKGPLCDMHTPFSHMSVPAPGEKDCTWTSPDVGLDLDSSPALHILILLVNEGSFLVFGPIRKERKMVWIYCNLRKCSVPAVTAGSRLPICMPAVGCLYHLPGILWSSRLLLIGLGI